MLVIIIPSVTITLMMLNQRIRGFKDLILCLPSIALCGYSFLGVTVAPARLHDEVGRSRSCLIRNESIWFPYRRDVSFRNCTGAILSHGTIRLGDFHMGLRYIVQAACSCEFIGRFQTFSVMAMVLSMIIELTPASLEMIGHVLRANKDTVCKVVIDLEVPGKGPKPKGKPKQWWLDTLHADLKYLALCLVWA
ncbi:hypothetical protein ANCCAN_23309 [Ancylostoma caninum]|uniref:Uncharacterized protein n=1 Tax=Ancylostoma caninum TaxID=29170 RepID=A0A368FJE3_ANCCA|nr:hypothetical protein ANCCAN_23309 [Ancylostoma caninum]